MGNVLENKKLIKIAVITVEWGQKKDVKFYIFSAKIHFS